MKEYYFLSGLPRSGNTLLSTILNENKNIHATGRSFLPDLLFAMKNKENNSEFFKNYHCPNNLKNIYKNIFPNYYQNYNVKYIIERGSITIDGISLTVVKIENNILELVLIPETISKTNASQWENNSIVNIETDILARYYENFQKYS